MITVSILINGYPLYTRRAVNTLNIKNGRHVYKLDDDSMLHHNRKDGAVALAIQMLKKIKELK